VVVIGTQDLAVCQNAGRLKVSDGTVDQALGFAPDLNVPMSVAVVELEVPDVRHTDPGC
jgi:hypothetical protein